MSVLLETSLGDMVIDLNVREAPRASENFVKLCKAKKYNNCLFYDVQRDYMVQTGDPTNTGTGGCSIWGHITGKKEDRYFPDEISKKRSFSKKGVVAMANTGPNMNSSGFFITLGDLDRGNANLHKRHTIFGEVVEGLDVLDKINKAYCDSKGRPYQNIRIKHTLIIDDPFDDPKGFREPSRSPSPVVIKSDLQNPAHEELYLDDDVDVNQLMQGKSEQQIVEEAKEHDTKTRAAVLEILEDLPDADIEPPKNVLFVCKLNPVTQSHDLELIFSRFGPITSCEVIRDWKSGDSLQYAFIEYESE